ncbi:unnamed protein product [Rotaria socialis]|nr:unnamed protein product [Rotaria socialis]CAF3446811.1 unnamed protein product [Rotaria socialis]CAF3622570.1 unnamed protein product [Rotaria socialis]CAF3636993.1 unnamed protein product [Rotaria socialis]CAF3683163.1 unnamed protein product [Rotaria socialis]
MPFCAGINLTSTDLDYYQKIYFQKSWAWWVNHIGTFAVFVIGFLGNLLCLLVLCRGRLRRNSYTQYLIALAIVDTGAILCETLIAFDELHQYRNPDKRTLIQHTILCKLYYYIRFVFYSMSSWVLVALAIERLVAVRFPLWSKYICNVINARRILFLILLFTLIIQSYHLVMKGLDCSPSSKSTTSKQNCRCKTLVVYAEIDVKLTIYFWRLTLMTLLPLAIIITANILIMSKLFSEHSLMDHTNTSDNSRSKTVLLFKISRMLVILTTIYLILHVPGSSLEVIKYLSVYVFHMCNAKWEYYMLITHEIFDLLTNFNYGINFYLYIISGKHIRNELVRAFKSASFRSTSSSEQNGKFQRSSYFISSHGHMSRTNQPHYTNVQSSRQPIGSSI